MSGELRFDVEGPPTRPDLAWRLVGDTDWLNRLAGNGQLQQLTIAEDAEHYPAITGAFKGKGGSMRFEETDVSWVEGRSFRQERSYQSRLFTRTVYEAELVPQGDGTVRPRLHLQVEPGLALLRPIIRASVAGIGRRWAAALAALPGPGVAWEEPPLRALPPAAVAAFERWGAKAPPAVVDRTRRWVERARPSELQRMRPWELADRWGMDRGEVLAALLRGVVDGALELYWSVRCERCHGSVASSPLLSDLADHADCPSCQVAFATDLGANVEVLLTPHPAVVPRVEQRFCTLFPLGAPDIRALFVVQPDAVIRADVPVEAGHWRIDAGARLPHLEVTVGQEGDPHVRWSAAGGPAQVSAPGGTLALELHNPTRRRARVHLSRVGAEDKVPASALTTLPAFRRMMGHQVLSPTLRIAVRSVAVVFTDLAGSTAMYEALGDAGAFAFVRDHFELLRGVVEEHGGVVVKTVGDGLMAAFHEAGAAAAASLDMLARFDGWAPRRDLDTGLKVGVHAGPALVVHSDTAGIDYFGATVNLSARAQGVAKPGEAVWTRETLELPGVTSAIERFGARQEEDTVALRGITGTRRVLRLSPGTPRPAR